MSHHLDDATLAAAVAGLDPTPEQRRHLADCLACRRAVDELQRTIAGRRFALEAEAPDWDAQRRAILARLPQPRPAARPRSSAPLLALAATILVGAIGLGVWQFGLEAPAGPPADAAELERVLAEADALLADDSIPGFEPIDPFGEPRAADGWEDDMQRVLANGAS